MTQTQMMRQHSKVMQEILRCYGKMMSACLQGIGTLNEILLFEKTRLKNRIRNDDTLNLLDKKGK